MGARAVTRRELAAVLVLLAIVLILAALWPPSTKSDQPAVSRIPSSEFVPIGSAGTPRLSGQTTPAPALPQPRTMPVVVTLKGPAAPTPAPSATAGVGVHGDVAGTVRGVASWFASPIGVSAAGPALRTALGPGWRSDRVHVTGPAGSATTTLGDWMAADRLIDLDVNVFPAVCGPLSLGLCRVEVTW